jgi:hypothetical protein
MLHHISLLRLKKIMVADLRRVQRSGLVVGVCYRTKDLVTQNSRTLAVGRITIDGLLPSFEVHDGMFYSYYRHINLCLCSID